MLLLLNFSNSESANVILTASHGGLKFWDLRYDSSFWCSTFIHVLSLSELVDIPSLALTFYFILFLILISFIFIYFELLCIAFAL